MTTSEATPIKPYPTPGGLSYGPCGDPNSTDPWERGQAQMPEGWHLDGCWRGEFWAYPKHHPGWKVRAGRGMAFEEGIDAIVKAAHVSAPLFLRWHDWP